MLTSLAEVEPFIGSTPLVSVFDEKIDLFAKLEYYNLSGSIKDRAAFNILRQAILAGEISSESTIIESSSGNFAIALATICRKLKLKFVAVVDPVINRSYEDRLRKISHRVIKVKEADAYGGFLLTRLNTVKEECSKDPLLFWTNQYQNPNNYLSYYKTLGEEVCSAFNELDYAFVAVSTGGTIAGLSMRLKERFPAIKMIAVDVEGSVIFGGKPGKRRISGLGASIRPPLVDKAFIDDVVYMSQDEIVEGCNALLKRDHVWGGGSTGAVYGAIDKYFRHRTLPRRPKVLFLCADRGGGYVESVYNREWMTNTELVS